MRKVLKNAKNLWITPVIMSILLCGCNNNKNNRNNENIGTKQQLGTETQGDEIPEQLESLENSIEKIIITLNGPAIELKSSEHQDQTKVEEKRNNNKKKDNQDNKKNGSTEQDNSSQQNEGGQNEGGQNDSGQNEDRQNKGEQTDGTDQKNQQSATGMTQDADEPWQNIDTVINALHYQWSSYTPLAVKMNASRDLIDGFSTALNSLTNTVISKNKTNTLLAASHLYAYVPDFYSLYKTSTSPEIKRVRYYTRNAMFNAMTANWEQANSDVTSLKSIWNMYKNIIPEEQREDSNQLDYSMREFERVLADRNQPLCDIKGRVIMTNIQSLEESLQ